MKGIKNKYTKMQLREMRTGYIFVLPFIIGIIFFLALPIFDSIRISLGDINTFNGYDIVINGFGHYRDALEDVDYIKYLSESLKQTAINTPLTGKLCSSPVFAWLRTSSSTMSEPLISFTVVSQITSTLGNANKAS